VVEPSIPHALEGRLEAALEQSRRLGFLGPGPIETHIALALELATIVEHLAPARTLDLGSGGGVPGLVLLAALPRLHVVLLDASQRRTQFLREAVISLGFAERAEVVTARAEAAGRQPDLRHGFDVVVARSFGPPATTAECAAPLLRLGGHLVVSEPPDGGDRWPAAGLAPLGLEPVPLSGFAGLHHYAILRAVRLCDDRYPRRDGVPAKRPLFVSRET